MRYIDGFRDPAAATWLARSIGRRAQELRAQGRRVRLMEVCGSHTMAIGRFGIRGMLPPEVELISGPGCPVCVTGPGYVDAALEIAAQGAVIATFGDMLRVPGSESTLAEARAAGARVEICYSPDAALDLARRQPDTQVVFLAIGFETTVAPVTSLVPAALREEVDNLSLLTAFKLVPPALEALIADPELAIDGFLCPAHVSAIIGAEAYRPVVERHGLPCVIASFEPLDILLGIDRLLEMIVAGRAELDNQYARVVRAQGNRRARQLIARHLEPVDADWRGLGRIPASGLGLRREFARFDAEHRFGVPVRPGRAHPQCRCGDVLRGKIRPPQCALFDRSCTPSRPVGACMVSAEGTCAAYWKYARTA